MKNACKMLKENNLCVLATCSDNLPNSSLMQYIYDDDSMNIFMLTLSGSVKYENIIANPQVSLLIDNRSNVKEAGLPIMALTVYGKATIVTDPQEKQALIDQLVDRNSNLTVLAKNSLCLVIQTKIEKILLLDGVNDKSSIETLKQIRQDVDSASRTHAFLDRSVDWIASFAENKGANVLDLGCGPGLYAKRFFDKGFRVTGIDFSKRSIAYASEHFSGEKNQFIYQDYLTIDYEEEYDIAILIYCDFGVLSPENWMALLKKIYDSLKSGGLFVVDVCISKQYKNFADLLTVEYSDGGFWRSEPYISITRSASYPNQNYLDQYTVITAEDCATYFIWNHGFEPQEMLIGDCGLTMQNINGSIKPKIGSHIKKDMQRNGYAKEAAPAVRDWTFENTPFKELYSYMKKANTSSKATAKSIGMILLEEFTDKENEISAVYGMSK